MRIVTAHSTHPSFLWYSIRGLAVFTRFLSSAYVQIKFVLFNGLSRGEMR